MSTKQVARMLQDGAACLQFDSRPLDGDSASDVAFQSTLTQKARAPGSIRKHCRAVAG